MAKEKVYENMLKVPNKPYEIPFFYKEDILNKRVSCVDRRWLTDESSLIYCLVYEMFKFMGDTRSYKDILEECFTSDNWFQEREWTIEESKKFKNEVGVPVIMKAWKMGKTRAEQEYAWFCLGYGFKYSDPENVMRS